MICGPKSAPIASILLDADPILDFERRDNRWWITDNSSGQRFDSPYRRDKPELSDLGYVVRHLIGNRVIVHVAGITSVGSLGVVHWFDATCRNCSAATVLIRSVASFSVDSTMTSRSPTARSLPVRTHGDVCRVCAIAGASRECRPRRDRKQRGSCPRRRIVPQWDGATTRCHAVRRRTNSPF